MITILVFLIMASAQADDQQMAETKLWRTEHAKWHATPVDDERKTAELAQQSIQRLLSEPMLAGGRYALEPDEHERSMTQAEKEGDPVKRSALHEKGRQEHEKAERYFSGVEKRHKELLEIFRRLNALAEQTKN